MDDLLFYIDFYSLACSLFKFYIRDVSAIDRVILNNGDCTIRHGGFKNFLRSVRRGGPGAGVPDS
ncbi:MAG TPA: hypothetical protein PK360_08995, partial [bacterium]|nr:hypothetical protein [bacterium]